jgi:hypothetical protein
VIDYHEYLRPKKPGSRGFHVDRAAFDAGRRRSAAPGCAASTACRDRSVGGTHRLGSLTSAVGRQTIA